ncbi:MAG: iron-containing alcohol dehydrogenase [Clostridia bacterium]|nr:iron-containing alcohol dehydrogenase [Clostridia bacterium]
MKYSVYSPTEIYSGAGCVLSFGKFSEYGKKCAVITGKNMYKKNSVLSDTLKALENENISCLTIAEAENNPSVKSVFDFSNRVKEFGAEFIIGIGGGSSMDTAKAVAIVAANDYLTEDTVFSVPSDAETLPVILIGTTAGTGSEVMPSAVLTIPGDIPIKKSVKTKKSYAKVALCDFTYTSSMPDNITVSTALDSVCHAIEAIYSKRGGEWSDIYGHAALKKVIPALFDFVENKGKIESIREDLYFGSILAGLAINDGGTSFPHSMGYMITTMHDTAHGFACAVFIGQFLERVSKISDVSETLRACGMSSVDEFKNKIDLLISKYYTRPELTSEQAKKYAELAMKMNVNNNYLELTQENCEDIYLEMSRGACK